MKTKYPQASEWSADCGIVPECRNSSNINNETNVDSRMTLVTTDESNAKNYVTVK